MSFAPKINTGAPKTSSGDDRASFTIRAEDFSKALLDPSIAPPTGVGKKSTTDPAPKRFNVYRNNVIVSLMDALKAAYPSILAILGEDNFNKVARIHVTSFPPKNPMMQTYGSEFPDFLQNFKPLRNSPFLADLAKAEQAWLSAYHARDGEPINPEILAGFSPEETTQLTFKFHSAAKLIKSEFPLMDLFNYRVLVPQDDIDLSISQSMLITRPALEVMSVALDAATTRFFEVLLKGQTLAHAIDAALELNANFDASQAIATLIQTGACTSAGIAQKTKTG